MCRYYLLLPFLPVTPGAVLRPVQTIGQAAQTKVYIILEGTPALVSSTVTNTRAISVQNGQLYFSTGSGTCGIYAVGTGLPIITGQTSVNLINTGTSTTSSPYAFAFNSTSDICYISDDRTSAPVGGVQKWTKSGSIWSLSYTLSVGAAIGARDLP